MRFSQARRSSGSSAASNRRSSARWLAAAAAVNPVMAGAGAGASTASAALAATEASSEISKGAVAFRTVNPRIRNRDRQYPSSESSRASVECIRGFRRQLYTAPRERQAGPP
jgi:hypothetical protein